jgi:hypothetical protein
VAYGALTTSYLEYQFGLSYTLTNGVAYWLVVKQSAAPAGGAISINSAASGTALWATSSNGTTWSTVNSVTAWFKLYGQTGYGVYGSS